MFWIGRGATAIGAADRARHGDCFIFVGKWLEQTGPGGGNPFNPLLVLFLREVRIDVVGGNVLTGEWRAGGGGGLWPRRPFLRQGPGPRPAFDNTPPRFRDEAIEK